jgi:starvation-inducible outer membrane lipoprotein
VSGWSPSWVEVDPFVSAMFDLCTCTSMPQELNGASKVLSSNVSVNALAALIEIQVSHCL